ncbi:MAG TPA: P-type conjugative transfer protein TrbJ [Nitrosospira sp.]
MRNTRNLKQSALLSLLVGTLWMSPANAFLGAGDIVFDPSARAEQIAQGAVRAAEAARQLQVQLNQYTQMVRDGLSLADPVFKPLGDTLRSLNSVYMQGQSLMYSAQNMDMMFGSMYPSYYSYLGTMGQGRPMSQTMPALYQQWSDKGYENTRKAMLASGMQVEGMQSEHDMLQRLVLQSNTAGGQMAALQAGNQIAANQAEQMQSLRLLIAQQNNLHANFMAQQIEQQSARNAFTQQYKAAPVNNSPAQDF